MVVVRLYLECVREEDSAAADEGLQFIWKDVDVDVVPRIGEEIFLNYSADLEITNVTHIPGYLKNEGRPGVEVACEVPLELIKRYLNNEEGWVASG